MHQNASEKQTIECWWCEKTVSTIQPVIEAQLYRHAGFFCSEQCKSEFVHEEFDAIMRQP